MRMERHTSFGGTPGPEVTMRLTDPTLYNKLFFNPELAAGEAYMDGRMSFENSTLRDFLTLFSVNRLSLGSYPLQKVLRTISRGLKRFQQANPVGKAQKNVAHHYDIGNDFYRLFLDKGMQYSCAYFINDDNTLEDAQQNKLRLIASKLNLKAGQSVLDIGCGWGDMALYLARMENVSVLGVTLSKEQCSLANEKAKQLGLADRVRFELRDYRDVTERFDRIVSVGMFEHVGVHHYGEFFAKVNRAHDRRRHHAAPLDRPHESAGHGISLAQEVHLSRRLLAGTVGSLYGRRAEQPLGHGPGVPAAALCQDARALGASVSKPTAPWSPKCTTSAFAVCGSSILSAPR